MLQEWHSFRLLPNQKCPTLSFLSKELYSMWPWHTYQQQSCALHSAVQGIFRQVRVLRPFDNPDGTCKQIPSFRIHIYFNYSSDKIFPADNSKI